MVTQFWLSCEERNIFMLEYVKILKTFDPEISPKEIIGQLHKDILVGMLPVLYKRKNWKQLKMFHLIGNYVNTPIFISLIKYNEAIKGKMFLLSKNMSE